MIPTLIIGAIAILGIFAFLKFNVHKHTEPENKDDKFI